VAQITSSQLIQRKYWISLLQWCVYGLHPELAQPLKKRGILENELAFLPQRPNQALQFVPWPMATPPNALKRAAEYSR
jgi:hypothetical protein